MLTNLKDKKLYWRCTLVCHKYVASEYVTKYLRKIEYTPSVMQRRFNDRKFSILSNSR